MQVQTCFNTLEIPAFIDKTHTSTHARRPGTPAFDQALLLRRIFLQIARIRMLCQEAPAHTQAAQIQRMHGATSADGNAIRYEA